MKAKRRGVPRTSTDSKKNGHEKSSIQQDIVRRNLAEELMELGLNPIRRVRRGKGLTEREYDEYELIDLALLLSKGPDAAHVVTDALSKGFPLILDQLAKIDKTARKKLRDLNLPDSDELIELKKDGSWKPVSSDHNHRRQQRSMLGLELALSEHESPSWFAAQNLRLIGEIREHWPNSLGAISAAFKLGILVEREWWKIKHETVAIRGYRDAENRKKGRAQGTVTTKQNAAQRYAIVVSRAKAFWASQPTLKNKLTQTARHIEALKLDQLRLSGRRDFLGFEAIKKHLRKASRRGDLK